MTPAEARLRYLALQELADKIGDEAARCLVEAPYTSSALVEAAVAVRCLSELSALATEQAA